MRKEKTTITLDKNIKIKATEIAKSNGLSLSAYITILINKAVKDNEQVN